MTKGLSAAQRRAVTGSDPATGRLTARADVCAALAARGLAVPHGRSGHHSHYLSTEGLRLRAELAAAAAPSAQPSAVPAAGDGTGTTAGPAPGGAFAADTGTDTGTETGLGAAPGTDTGPLPGAAPGTAGGTGAPGGGARRAAEVAAAWEGLLQIRALLLDGTAGVPAPWERERSVHAVALALEAAGCPPAGPDRTGYTVTAATAQPGVAEVGWRGPVTRDDEVRALTRCAALLETHGWQCTRHSDRSGRAFLLASPRWGR